MPTRDLCFWPRVRTRSFPRRRKASPVSPELRARSPPERRDRYTHVIGTTASQSPVRSGAPSALPRPTLRNFRPGGKTDRAIPGSRPPPLRRPAVGGPKSRSDGGERGDFSRTNRAGAGLRSVPRRNKPTRALTRPGRTTKSSAKDSSPRVAKLQSASWRRRISAARPVAGLLRFGAKAYSYPSTTCGSASPLSGMDSDLEAFSHNPADGSFAALPGQTAAKTNYLNPRFLSY